MPLAHVPSQSVECPLLARLPLAERRLLEPHVKRVAFTTGQLLARAGHELQQVVFLDRGVVSGLKEAIEVLLLGRGDMVGYAVMLGEGDEPLDLRASEDGEGICVDRDALSACLHSCPFLHAALLACVRRSFVQLAHIAASNALHSLDQRLARRLLMAHDLHDDDTLPVTHAALAAMLGVRRAGVTEALQQAEGEGLIRSLRGRVVVRDRIGLERLAGPAYRRFA